MKTKYIAAAVLALTLLNPLNASAEGKNGVAAVVNGEKLTVAEIKKIYDNTPQINTQEKWDVFYPKALWHDPHWSEHLCEFQRGCPDQGPWSVL